jgi:hypothetical protein
MGRDGRRSHAECGLTFDDYRLRDSQIAPTANANKTIVEGSGTAPARIPAFGRVSQASASRLPAFAPTKLTSK